MPVLKPQVVTDQDILSTTQRVAVDERDSKEFL